MQNSYHCSVFSLKEDISDLFSKVAVLKIKFYQVGEGDIIT